MAGFDDQNDYRIYGGEKQDSIYQSPHVTYTSAPEEKPKSGVFNKFLGICFAAILFGALTCGAYYCTNRLIKHFDTGAFAGTGTAVSEENGKAVSTVSDQGILATTTVSANKIAGTSVSDIVERSLPFTVAVNCTFTSSSWFGQYTSQGSGTGIIVGKNDTELLIVTNNHVVDKAKTVAVVFADGTEISAVGKGNDSSADLAVIAVKLSDISEDTMNSITFAKLGDSDNVKVGEMVVAIGNALGYGQSVTVGYISAKNRQVTVDNNTMTLLQTDAAINPGNSGGALINMDGEVIGINSVKYADESVEGMGFAIPVTNVKEIIETLMNALSDDEKGYIGIYITEVTEEIASYYDWPRGIYVKGFTENSAAEAAGIEVGDIITAVNGREVLESDKLISTVTTYRYGTVVDVTLKRKVNGEWKEITVQVTLSQKADYAEPTPTPTQLPRRK